MAPKVKHGTRARPSERPPKVVNLLCGAAGRHLATRPHYVRMRGELAATCFSNLTSLFSFAR
jgi:hypothetical protein